jgi:hypothetical protein
MGREGRRPAPGPWGRGRSGWAAAHGCAGRRPVCCPFLRLGFAARRRCGPSPGVVQLQGLWTGDSDQPGCLSLSRHPTVAPEFPAYVAPVACGPLVWSSGGRSPQVADALETCQNSRRRWQSRLLSPLLPPADRPRVSSAYIAVPYDRPAHVRCQASRPRAHPPSAAGGRRSLRFAQRLRHVRRQDASRVFPAARVRWRRALRDCGDADTACCVRVWCLIARPLGRDWVCA